MRMQPYHRPAMRADDVWFDSLETRSRKRSRTTENCCLKTWLTKRCKILAVGDIAIVNFLTSILPLDILRGSCRVRTTPSGDNAGGVAQLGERLNGIQEVRGSIPLTSMARGNDKNSCLFAGIAQLVEHNLAKVGVAGSSPVSRSRVRRREGRLAQLVRAPR